jgi:hypothetical protein
MAFERPVILLSSRSLEVDDLTGSSLDICWRMFHRIFPMMGEPEYFYYINLMRGLLLFPFR